MNKIHGVWVRHGVELSITDDKIVTKVLDPVVDARRTLTHDYLLEKNRLQLYSPTVRDIRHAFKRELRIITLTPYEMTLESEGDITHWNRR